GRGSECIGAGEFEPPNALEPANALEPSHACELASARELRLGGESFPVGGTLTVVSPSRRRPFGPRSSSEGGHRRAGARRDLRHRRRRDLQLGPGRATIRKPVGDSRSVAKRRDLASRDASQRTTGYHAVRVVPGCSLSRGDSQRAYRKGGYARG